MIRGAMILAVGFSLGYAKALHDNEDIREGLAAIVEVLKTDPADRPSQKETVEGTATETLDHAGEGEDVDDR